MSFATADLCDAHDAEVQVVELPFHDFGGRRSFAGAISTVRAPEDNTLVRKALEEPGNGRVLVIDAGGSMRCAVLGDQLAALAVKNSWAGILVNGCIRDSEAIARMDVGVKALGTNPRKTVKRNEGQRDVAVRFGGVTFTAGAFVYADGDGVIVAASALTAHG